MINVLLSATCLPLCGWSFCFCTFITSAVEMWLRWSSSLLKGNYQGCARFNSTNAAVMFKNSFPIGSYQLAFIRFQSDMTKKRHLYPKINRLDNQKYEIYLTLTKPQIQFYIPHTCIPFFCHYSLSVCLTHPAPN